MVLTEGVAPRLSRRNLHQQDGRRRKRGKAIIRRKGEDQDEVRIFVKFELDQHRTEDHVKEESK